MVVEFCTEDVTGFQQRPHTAIAPVAGITFVITYDTSRLMTLIVTTEGGTRRHADQSVEIDACLHHDIDNACGEQSAQGTSFQNKSFLHHAPKSFKYLIYFVLWLNHFVEVLLGPADRGSH